jgi:uridylate kinase
MENNQIIVLSLGGSLIVPGEIDTKFLKQLKKLLVAQIKKGNKFIIITGGGKICRKYQHALGGLNKLSAEDLDWMGIYLTRVNAQFIRLIMKPYSHPKIVEDTNKKVNFKEKILLAGGWEPGRSTDDDAVRMANAYGAKTVINLSNIDYVYNKDPKKFKNAAAYKNLTWDGFLKITGKKWIPGKNLPFDPQAAQNAKKWGISVIITNGNNIKNLKNILSNKKFKGTTIK